MNPREIPLRGEDSAVQEILDRISGLELPLSAEHRLTTIGAAAAAVGGGSPTESAMSRLAALPTTSFARAAAVGLVAVLTLSGLAAAQALPAPVQQAAERVAAILGLNISEASPTDPASQIPPATPTGDRLTLPSPTPHQTSDSTGPRIDIKCDEDAEEESSDDLTISTTGCTDDRDTTNGGDDDDEDFEGDGGDDEDEHDDDEDDDD